MAFAAESAPSNWASCSSVWDFYPGIRMLKVEKFFIDAAMIPNIILVYKNMIAYPHISLHSSCQEPMFFDIYQRLP